MTIDAELIKKLQRQRKRIGEPNVQAAVAEEVPNSPGSERVQRLSSGSVKEMCQAIEGSGTQSPSAPVEENAAVTTPSSEQEKAAVTTPSSEQDTSASAPTSSGTSPQSSCSETDSGPEVSGCARPPASWEKENEEMLADAGSMPSFPEALGPAVCAPAMAEEALGPAVCAPAMAEEALCPAVYAPVMADQACLQPQPVTTRKESLAARAQSQLARQAAASRSPSTALRTLSPVDENRVMAWQPARPQRSASSRGVPSRSPQPFARTGRVGPSNVALSPSLDAVKADLRRRREVLQEPSVLQQRRQAWQNPGGREVLQEPSVLQQRRQAWQNPGGRAPAPRSPRKASPDQIVQLESHSEDLLEQSRMCRDWASQCLELASQAERLRLEVVKKRELRKLESSHLVSLRKAARNRSPQREWRLPRESPLMYLPDMRVT